jgi:hypothetical protein
VFNIDDRTLLQYAILEAKGLRKVFEVKKIIVNVSNQFGFLILSKNKIDKRIT